MPRSFRGARAGSTFLPLAAAALASWGVPGCGGDSEATPLGAAGSDNGMLGGPATSTAPSLPSTTPGTNATPTPSDNPMLPTVPSPTPTTDPTDVLPTPPVGNTAGAPTGNGTAGAGNDVGGGTGGMGTTPPVATDLPSTDPATWFGAPRCEGLTLCESFESTAAGQLPAGWTLTGYGDRTLGVQADRAARGANALRVDIADAQGAVVGVMTRDVPAELAESHWGRELVFIAGPAEPAFVHYDLFSASGPFSTYSNEVRMAVTGTGLTGDQGSQKFIYNVQPFGNGAPAEFGTESAVRPIVDDWMCLEWFMDANAQEARFFYQGVEIEAMHIDTERAEIPVLENFNIGFQKFQMTGDFQMWVDEVAFHTERIGCNN